MNATPPAAKALFLAAIRLPPDAWPAFVRDQCGDDADLRRLLEGLLDAHREAASRAADPDGTVGHRPAADPDRAGTAIGPYTLREAIGEGGMGVVYVADQAEPVRRRVALKVIKPGMDSKQVVARFEQERQALALMDHPNIARVFDGGATPDGRPYFVMELVRGLPVTDYCDQARLPTADRLRLVADVCRAVQHAHQKGVIHRDLKPDNVLVTVIDGKPVPKVIDFGIAKATGAALTDHTVYTGFAQLVGTPLYMSPEQAELSGVDVDTRADVYSLGVLLYELLTGTTPFSTEEARNAGLDELRRMIREDEPPRPSHRVITLDAKAGTTVSNRRGLDQRQLGRLLRGDLDWIVMTALEKDRNRRYESAGAFAADVERYLGDQPVEARPPSAWYRFRKFARRNKAALLVASVVTAALLVGVTGAAGGVGWVARDRAVRQAEAARAASEALDEADRWERRAKWSDALSAVKRAEALLGEEGGDEELRTRVRRRKEDLTLVLRLEEIRQEMTGEGTGVPYDYGRGRKLYAEAFRDYGLDIEAMEPEDVARSLPATDVWTELVAALEDWTKLCRATNDRGWERLLTVVRAADPDPLRNRIREAWAKKEKLTLKGLGGAALLDHLDPSTVFFLQGAMDAPEAVAMLREAQRRRPGEFRINHYLAGRLRMQPSQKVEAISFYRVASALRPENASVLTTLGALLEDVGRVDEAVATYEQALRVRPGHATAHFRLGLVLSKRGMLDDAVIAFRNAAQSRPDYSNYHEHLGSALMKTKAWDKAIAAFTAAIRLYKRETPYTATLYSNLGLAFQEKGQLHEALKAFRRSHELNPSAQSAASIKECVRRLALTEP